MLADARSPACPLSCAPCFLFMRVRDRVRRVRPEQRASIPQCRVIAAARCVNCFFLCFFCSLGHSSLTVRSVFPSFCVSNFFVRALCRLLDECIYSDLSVKTAAGAVVAARKRPLQLQRGDFLARKSDVHAYLPTYDISFSFPSPRHSATQGSTSLVGDEHVGV